MAKELLLQCVVTFADGSGTVLDMEEEGYRSALSGKVIALALIPKDGALASDGTSFQPVAVQIPKGAEPVLLTRRKASFNMSDGSDVVGLRIYGVGYRQAGVEPIIAWVLPDGSVEIGPDSVLADQMLDRMNAQAMGVG